MHNGFGLEAGKSGGDRAFIGDVGFDKVVGRVIDNRCDILQRAGVAELVEGANAVLLLYKASNEGGADETCAAGN